MFAIKVKKKDAEKVRKKLLADNALNKDYMLKKEGDYIYIPVKKKVPNYENINIILEKTDEKAKSLKFYLKNDINEELLDSLPNSLDIIGDIAIVEIIDELKPFAKKIGEAILKIHKNINVVAMKAGFYTGQYRTRKLEIIAGENRKVTIHKENEVKLKLNVETCYFSPRLSTERKRVYKKIKQNESVLVMFSGIGPYVVSILKNSPVKKVVGVEINPEAHKYALENVMINKLSNVKLYKGDVRTILPDLNEKFDRVIMPLPKTAESFLDLLNVVAKENAIIHFYCFLHENEIPEKGEKLIKNLFSRAEILDIVKCGQASPGKYRVCIDFKFKK